MIIIIQKVFDEHFVLATAQVGHFEVAVLVHESSELFVKTLLESHWFRLNGPRLQSSRHIAYGSNLHLVNIKLVSHDITLMSTFRKGMVLSTSSSKPSMSRLKKSTRVRLRASSRE